MSEMIARIGHELEDEYASMFGKRCSTEHGRRLARRALQALREPTTAMLEASRPAFAEVNNALAIAAIHHFPISMRDGKPPLWHAWNAMIDEALK